MFWTQIQPSLILRKAKVWRCWIFRAPSQQQLWFILLFWLYNLRSKLSYFAAVLCGPNFIGRKIMKSFLFLHQNATLYWLCSSQSDWRRCLIVFNDDSKLAFLQNLERDMCVVLQVWHVAENDAEKGCYVYTWSQSHQEGVKLLFQTPISIK